MAQYNTRHITLAEHMISQAKLCSVGTFYTARCHIVHRWNHWIIIQMAWVWWVWNSSAPPTIFIDDVITPKKFESFNLRTTGSTFWIRFFRDECHAINKILTKKIKIRNLFGLGLSTQGNPFFWRQFFPYTVLTVVDAISKNTTITSCVSSTITLLGWQMLTITMRLITTLTLMFSNFVELLLKKTKNIQKPYLIFNRTSPPPYSSYSFSPMKPYMAKKIILLLDDVFRKAN